MVLTKEDSIVADSTASSPPAHAIATVKRPTKTYGRPRDSSTVADPEHRRSSSSSSATANIGSIYWTAPVNTQEEIPPSSEPPHSSPGDRQRYVDEGENVNSSSDAFPSFEFSWRRNLRDMDRDDDIDDAENDESGERTSSSKSRPVSAPKPLIAEQREANEAGSSQRAGTPPAPLLDDIFGGSSTTGGSSAQGPSDLHTEHYSSPVKNERRVSGRVEDENEESDAEQEEPEESSATKPSPIIRPTRASSFTPPTAGDGIPANKQQQKGNRGASARRNVPPLTFEDDQITSFKPGGTSRPQNKERKRVKGLTKKEKQEMQKESHRIKAGREVHITQAEPSKNFTLSSWAKSVIGDTSKTQRALSNPPKGDPKSSPISEYSSPLSLDKRPQNTHPSLLNPRRNVPSLALSLAERRFSDGEDELPELGNVVANVQAASKPESDDKRRDLHARKLALLARMNQIRPIAGEVDDEGDLQIVDSATPPTGTKRNPATHGVPSASTSSAHRNRIHSRLSAKRGKKTMVPGDINKDLMQRVQEVGKSVRDKKEAEWLRNGGMLPEMKQNDHVPVESMHELLQKSFDERRKAKDEQGEEEDEDENEGSDEDWNSDQEERYRGSASPDPEVGEVGEDADVDITMVNTLDNKGHSQDAPLKRPRTKRATIHTVHSDSEEENDENVSPALAVPSATVKDDDVKMPSVRRGSVSSFEGGTEDEYDKENDTRRMYDRSEDKENTVVVRLSTASRPSLGSRQGSLFGLEEGLSSRLSMSPGQVISDEENDENDHKGLQRQPLQPLEPRKALLSSPDSFFNRLHQVEPDSVSASSGGEPTSTLEPALNLIGPRLNAEFSQFSDEEFENAVPKPLQGGLADLFDSTTQNSPSSRNRHLGTLKPPPSLGLTQDVDARPVLLVDDQLQRKADEIFEKEQGWVIDRADEQCHKRPELYVNDAGFLTQTRPEGTPDIYRPLPTQIDSISRQPSQALVSQRRTLSEASLASSSVRTPFSNISLATLDFDGTLVDSPSNRSRRRLMKKRQSSSPSGDARAPQLAMSTALRDPFKSRKDKVPKDKGLLPQKSVFVEAEAQESDEEEMFGFVRKKGGDDEEDDENEDQDKTLETLVDDGEMDEDTVNREAVLEKFQEHAEADDQKLEKMNKDVVEGEWRKKRRRGIGVDDSDEEFNDDYEQRRIRQKMYGHGQIDRQNIKELGNHPETSAFFDSYRKGIQDEDDNNDLAYLVEGRPDVAMGDATMVEEEREEEEEVVTAAQIQAELRQAAQNNIDEGETAFDPRDISWADEQDEELTVPVKIVRGRRAIDPRGARGQPDEHDIHVQPSRFMDNDQQRASMHDWAKTENRMRSRGGNGRSVASATITGHKKAKFASGGGSLRGLGSGSKDAGVGTARIPKSVKAAPSFLNNPALERTSRFG
ncbi:hypothetical protein E1B28_004097 [Marasmius oreades]|uniref:DNA replication checkpoint mediator MRC1 domain-containing protein n=1 Tax=Marasmius oreades TaxID=181124 RepID=A0A9P7UXX0_9AGAR|nr:uncharacterized protein E1B28_004097 [Marasmius oreades]KAG7096683.1 hypothetical protein E1B28_004097 [Marasmius oreades]